MIFKIEPRVHCHLVKLCVLAEIDVFQLKLNADQNGQLPGVGFDIKN